MSCSYRGVRSAGTCVHCARERGSGSTRGGRVLGIGTVIRKFLGPNSSTVRCVPYRNDMRLVYTPMLILHSIFPGSVSPSAMPLIDPRLCWRMRSTSFTTVWYSLSSTRPCGAAISM